jgi:hypothetical protein
MSEEPKTDSTKKPEMQWMSFDNPLPDQVTEFASKMLAVVSALNGRLMILNSICSHINKCGQITPPHGYRNNRIEHDLALQLRDMKEILDNLFTAETLLPKVIWTSIEHSDYCPRQPSVEVGGMDGCYETATDQT